MLEDDDDEGDGAPTHMLTAICSAETAHHVCNAPRAGTCLCLNNIISDYTPSVLEAAPIALPPAMDKLVVDVPLDVGVNRLYALLFGNKSTFMEAHRTSEVSGRSTPRMQVAASTQEYGCSYSLRAYQLPPPQGLRSVQSSTWYAAEAPAPDEQPQILRMRKVSYVKPLRVPIPMAPKQCNVWEEHRCAMLSERCGIE